MLFKKKSAVAAVMAVAMLLSACTTGGNTGTAATPAPVAPATSEAATATSAEPATSAAPVSAAPASTGGNVLHINNHEEPGSLHPALAQGTHESWILDHMFEGLYVKTKEGFAKGLAKETTTSADGLTWTFTLIDGAKWSNGDPVVAQDFMASYLYCLDPANASKYASQLYILKGAEAYNASTETDATKVKELIDAVGVKAPDDKTLILTVNNPMPYLPDLLTHYTFYPVNHKVQEADKDWATKVDKYVTNGPFKLTNWTNKVSITIEKNPEYRMADKVKIDKIEWSMDADMSTEWQKYQAGELDLSFPLLPAVIQQLQTDNSPDLKIEPDLATYYYLFNTKKKPFNNVKVRKALSMAINREALVKNVTKGGQKPAFGLTPPGVPDVTGDFQANVGDLFKEDVSGAKALLTEGLTEEGVDPASFSFTILFNTSDVHKKIAEAIQAMWKQNLGINVSLENAEFQVVLDRRHAGDYEVCRAGWIGDYADPLTFVEMFTTNHSLNDSHWSNADYDKFIQTSMTATDPTARMEALKSAEKILIGDEHVIMPIYFYTKPMAVKPYLKGVYVPVNRYPVFSEAYIEGK